MSEFTFDPYSPEIDANPFPTYKILRDDHPVFWCKEVGMWVYSRYTDIVAALHDWQTYSSAKGNLVDELPGRAGATLGTTDPPRHDRLRSLIQGALSRRALLPLEGPLRDSCRKHIAALRDRSNFDFVDDYAARVTLDLLFTLFALPTSDQDEVKKNAALMIQTDAKTRRKTPEHIAAFQWLADYASALAHERRKNPGNDLLSNFITAEIDGEKLLDNEIQMTVTTLIMAGVEALTSFMSVMALNLADHPEARRALVADPSLIREAMEESLRFNTSGQRARRYLTRDVEIHGKTLEEGSFVMLIYGSGNRDERRYPDPDNYQIRRRPGGHLGFGSGVHACVGSQIARLTCVVAFEEFLAAFPEFERTQDALVWAPSSNFRALLRLPITSS